MTSLPLPINSNRRSSIRTRSSKRRRQPSSPIKVSTTFLFLLLISLLLLIPLIQATEEPLPSISTETPNTRVIGGNPVEDPFSFPYFAQLADSSCAAALIHDDYLLSAAHCERRTHPFYKSVYFGSTDLQQGIYRTIQMVKAHPAYLPTLQDYDFALLKLSTSALLDEYGNATRLKIIEMNRNSSVPQPGDALQAMGFGKISESAQGMHPTLQEVQINYVDDTTCVEQYGADQFFRRVMFCAGIEGGGKDTCQGDSGGPIVDVQSGTLAGVVSYGIGCARRNYAGVNSRVSSVVDWIDAEICRGSDYPPPHCQDRTDYVEERESTISLKGNETLGRMTLHGQLDDYPQEFAFSLHYLGTNATTSNTDDELYLQLPNSVEQLGAPIQTSFDHLLPGQYDLQFGDNGLDGICCGFGKGELRLINDRTGDVVWEHDGRYRGYLQTRLDVNDRGDIVVIYQSEDYQPSWERLTLPNFPPDFDPEWPGPMPTAPLFSFNVNFKFDAYPHENRYDVNFVGGYNVDEFDVISDLEEEEWEYVEGMNGIMDGVHNELVVQRFDQQEPGWYWLKVQDSNKDGICCDFRRGWVSITGPIITTMDYGFVWGNDGEFGSGVDVYFYINSDGFIAAVHWIIAEDAAIERTVLEEPKKKKEGDGGRRYQTRKL